MSRCWGSFWWRRQQYRLLRFLKCWTWNVWTNSETGKSSEHFQNSVLKVSISRWGRAASFDPRTVQFLTFVDPLNAQHATTNNYLRQPPTNNHNSPEAALYCKLISVKRAFERYQNVADWCTFRLSARLDESRPKSRRAERIKTAIYCSSIF